MLTEYPAIGIVSRTGRVYCSACGDQHGITGDVVRQGAAPTCWEPCEGCGRILDLDAMGIERIGGQYFVRAYVLGVEWASTPATRAAGLQPYRLDAARGFAFTPPADLGTYLAQVIATLREELRGSRN
jgi:hypothetical protein